MRHAFLILSICVLAGCAARPHVPIEMSTTPPCDLAAGIEWAGPSAGEHRTKLTAWCESVGSVTVINNSAAPVDVNQSGLIVVTWNQHGGHGDLEKLLRSLIGKSAVLALVQEVARSSETVPREIAAGFKAPARIGPKETTKQQIERIAHQLNLSAAYLPSMPNGSKTGEDRGNAILSTLPISDVIGIELPWVSQRRVAVMATLTAINKGSLWQFRAVSFHLDNRPARSLQAEALADFLASQLPELPTIVGGDLNSWFGISDSAVRAINRVVPLVQECGDSGTFRFFGFRLDHFFTTLAKHNISGCVIAPERFDSDHYPIVLRLFTPQ